MISVCPKCDGKINVPVDADRDANCQCPLCNVEFSLGELLDQTAPSLLLVNAVAGPIPTSQPETGDDSTDVVEESAMDGDNNQRNLEPEVTDFHTDDIASAVDATVPITGGSTDSSEDELQSFADDLADDEKGQETDIQRDVAQFEQRLDDLPPLDDSADDDVVEFLDEASHEPDDFAIEEILGGDAGSDDAAAPSTDEAAIHFDSVTTDPAGVDEETGAAAQAAPTSGSAFAFHPSNQPDVAPAVSARIRVPMMPRAKKSPVIEGFKLALGGIAGLVIAQAILWWLPQGWRRDPLGLAPLLPKPIAMIAPQDLRQEKITGKPPGDVGNTSNPANFPEKPDFDAAFEQAQNASEVNPVEELDGRITGDSSGDSPALIEPTTEGNDEEPPELLSVGPIDAPSYSRDDLGGSLATARAAFRALEEMWSDDSISVKQKTQQATVFFRACNDLAEKTTLVRPDGNGETIESAMELVREIAAGNSIAVIKRFSDRQINDGSSEGICLTAVVKSIEPSGQLFEIEVELLGKLNNSVHIVTPDDPQSNLSSPYAVGQQVIVMGARVKDPLAHLAGYDGVRPMVVWSKHAFRLPN